MYIYFHSVHSNLSHCHFFALLSEIHLCLEETSPLLEESSAHLAGKMKYMFLISCELTFSSKAQKGRLICQARPFPGGLHCLYSFCLCCAWRSQLYENFITAWPWRWVRQCVFLLVEVVMEECTICLCYGCTGSVFSLTVGRCICYILQIYF